MNKCDSIQLLSSHGGERLLWVDVVKFFSIYLMILFHLWISNFEDWHSFIGAFNMPVFFFLSGYTCKNRSTKETLLRSFKQLIIPYILFTVFSYLYWVPVIWLRHPEIYEHSINELFIKPFLGLVLAFPDNTKFSTNLNGPLWFLRALFWCRIYDSISLRVKENISVIIKIFISVVVCICCSYFKYKNYIPWSIVQGLFGYQFFILAKLIHMHLGDVFKRINCFFRFVLSLILFAIVFFLAKSNGYFSIPSINFGNNIFISYINALLGIFGCCFLFSIITRVPKMFEFLSRNTLTVLACHYYCLNVIVIFFKLFFKFDISYPNLMKWYIGVFKALFTTILCIIPALFFNKFFPIMIGKAKIKELNK